MLNVKSSSSLSKKVYQQRLALAAFYSTDRNVLRSLIEKGKVPSDFVDRVVKPPKKQVETVKKAAHVVKKSPSDKVKVPLSKLQMAGREPIDAQQLRDEVMANLELLQETKSSLK